MSREPGALGHLAYMVFDQVAASLNLSTQAPLLCLYHTFPSSQSLHFVLCHLDICHNVYTLLPEAELCGTSRRPVEPGRLPEVRGEDEEQQECDPSGAVL